MSLADSTFNLNARSGYGLYKSSVADGARYSLFEAGHSDGWQGGIMDTLVGRRFDRSIQAGFQNGKSHKAAGSDLNLAWSEVKRFSAETVKLRAGEITSSSSQGARQTNNQILNKEHAVKDMRAAIAKARNETKQNSSPKSTGEPVNRSAGKMFNNVVVSTAVGAAAETVMPGSSAAIAVAALGAGSFGAKTASSFSSAAQSKDIFGYQSSSGYETHNVMSSQSKAAPLSGDHINSIMARGPGFGSISMNQIEFGVEPSLEDQDVRMDEKGLRVLEGCVRAMEEDVKLGSSMYERWSETNIVGVDLGEVGDTPLAALRLSDDDAAHLMHDNPALKEEPLVINPIRLT